MRDAKPMDKSNAKTPLLGLVLTALLAGCGDRDVPDPEPSPTVAPTSIIREGFEEPVPEVVALAPLDVRIAFADGGAELAEDSIAELETVLASPQMEEGGPVVLRGHSDAGGSDEANMRASRERAEAVRDWLVENGVAEDRIELIAFGEQNPIEPNAKPDGTPNEAGRALNRRVDVHIGIETTREETMAEQLDEEARAGDEAPAARQQD